MEQPRRSLYPHQLGGGGHFGVGPGGSAMAQPSAQLASLQSCVASVSLSCQTVSGVRERAGGQVGPLDNMGCNPGLG